MVILHPDPDREDQAQAVESSTCHCEACKIARFEHSKLRNAVIHRYNYKPLRWRMKCVKDDKYSYFLGVELETDNYDGDSYDHPARLQNSMAADMRKPKYFWVVKYDSSVTGPEFASHPATLSYWKLKKPYLKEFFTTLLHAGFRSHRNGTCGMHINISYSAFYSPAHLFRFLTLIHENESWSLGMSQRTSSQARQWAGLYQDEASRKEICENALGSNSRISGGVTSKYSAVNIPYRESRIEFRLPRGTLRLDRFYKNLEWTVAMIEYSRIEVQTLISPERFMAFARGQKREFPNLVAFLDEKFPAQPIVKKEVKKPAPSPRPSPEPFVNVVDGNDPLPYVPFRCTCDTCRNERLRMINETQRMHDGMEGIY